MDVDLTKHLEEFQKRIVEREWVTRPRPDDLVRVPAPAACFDVEERALRVLAGCTPVPYAPRIWVDELDRQLRLDIITVEAARLVALEWERL